MTQLPLFFVRDMRRRGTPSALARDLEALWRGVRTPAAAWRAADEATRQHARVRAAVGLRREGVLVGESAALLHGIPLIDGLDPRVHVLARAGVGSRTRGSIRERSFAVPPDVVEIGGIPVSSIADTVVDLARHSTLRRAVVAVDHVLHAEAVAGRDPERLRETLRVRVDRLGSGRGVRMAAEAVSFADARPGLPLESVSRVEIAVAGFPAPRLRHAWHLPDGATVVTVFDWPACGLVGDIDGREMYGVLAAEQADGLVGAAFREKRRENALRLLGLRVIRWEWREAIAADPLIALLRTAGLLQRQRTRHVVRATRHSK